MSASNVVGLRAAFGGLTEDQLFIRWYWTAILGFQVLPFRKVRSAPLANIQSAARSSSIPVAGAGLENLRGTSNGSSWIRKAFSAGKTAEGKNGKRQRTNKGHGAAKGASLKTNASSDDNEGDMSGMARLTELRAL
jgi:hypothetical protein